MCGLKAAKILSGQGMMRGKNSGKECSVDFFIFIDLVISRFDTRF